MKTIKNLMTDHVISINETTRFTEACRMFTNFNVHHLVVLDEKKKLKGMFSSNDALQAYMLEIGSKVNNGKQSINELIQISDIMTSQNLITLDLNSSIDSAYDLFKQNKIHSILITDKDKLVGILTVNDLIE